ncbi:MAG: N-acetyl-gamma-glutamyl-phosphate reductase [Verrucomicrobiota bacterium]|nr:N-acetyl-gamma-glutamyl-phosphate reductase [Verrucomicrobiota bacterium]
MIKKINVSIIGASGYSGEELIRLMLRHPSININCITSRKYAGQQIRNVFPRFAEVDMLFSKPDVEEISKSSDVVFLALPHGLASEYAIPLLKNNLKIFDLSADFRIADSAMYEKYYKVPHPAPELLKNAVYGSPERSKDEIRSASLIACPGCYPTSAVLPLVPLLKNGLVDLSASITINSLSGVSGAGRKVALPFIFPECNESVKAYAVTGHRHIPEIEQELSKAGKKSLKVRFIPHLIPVNRGIQTTIAVTAAKNISEKNIFDALSLEYENEPFVRILPLGKTADTKDVTYTNFCEISCAYDTHTETIILNSAIDNLTKGAAGQAIQSMNIAFGFKETAGLL